MQKHVNLVDLIKSFRTNIYLQNLASIQKRTSPVKFARLAERSGKGSISNLSTKAEAEPPAAPALRAVERLKQLEDDKLLSCHYMQPVERYEDGMRVFKQYITVFSLTRSSSVLFEGTNYNEKTEAARP